MNILIAMHILITLHILIAIYILVSDKIPQNILNLISTFQGKFEYSKNIEHTQTTKGRLTLKTIPCGGFITSVLINFILSIMLFF